MVALALVNYRHTANYGKSFLAAHQLMLEVNKT